jgi:hypothetical protein
MTKLLWSRQKSWAGSLFSRKRTPNIIPSPLADRFTGFHLVSLPDQPLKQWGKAKHPLTSGYIGLLGPYLQHVISMFNTCSRVPTHQSLIDTDGSCNLGGVGFPQQSPSPSQPTALLFLLRVPSNLRLTILNMKHPIISSVVVYHYWHVASRPLVIYR